MLLICYPKCTTCMKSQKWLDDNGVHYEFRDIKINNPTYEELKGWYLKSGQLKLLATDGMLVKRPILISDDFVLVGFKESDWKQRMNK